jgi:integrase
MGNMSHAEQDKIAKYLNWKYTPQDIKISRMIIPKQVNKDGEATVYLRLRRYDALKQKDIIQRKMDTGVKVMPKYWSQNKGEVLRGDVDYKNKNRLIHEKESKVSSYIHNPAADYKFAQLKKEEFLLIEQVFPSERMWKMKKCLVDYIDDYYQRRKSLNHPNGTIKEYLTLKNRIKEFDDFRDNRTYLNDVNITWSDEFEIWLNKKKYATGTIQKTYTILITVLTHYWDIRDEMKLQMNDKFKSERFKRGDKSRNEPMPLSEEQLMALFNHRFEEKHLERVRKMILIQCFTGVRYGDLAHLRPQHFDDNILTFMPQKTLYRRKEVEQPLNPFAKQLLEEVGFDTSCYKMENQPYNRQIKEVFKLMAKEGKYKGLRFPSNVTSHNFRDTFISLAVMKGVNFKSILSWVGQSSYAVMDRYVKLNKPFQRSEMKKMFG